jgi:16S rRNA (cytosine967-C5)-methyltransferase
LTERLRAAVQILTRIRREGRFASDVFRESFARDGRSLEERGAIVELVLGVLRSERLLDRALTAKGVTPDDAARTEMGSPPPESIAEVEASPDPIQKIELLGSLPRWLALLMHDQLGDAAIELARSLAAPPPQTLRANRLKIDREQLRARLLEEGIDTEPTKLSQDGLTILAPTNPFRTTAFRDGLFEMQDEGSQLIAELVAPPPRSAVLDFCAGAGGKTLALAALLSGKGRVIAHDVSAPKLEELERRARRAGCSNVETRRELDGITPVARVLVDAPCSGLGVLRRNPELRLRLDPSALEQLPAEQSAILEQAASWVAEGGRLIYATCTFTPEENDQVVQAFLQTHVEFEPVLAKEILGRARAESIGDGKALRLYPHLHGTDAFYAAVLRRRG